MKYIIYLIYLLPSTLLAQHKINGSVKNRKGQPVQAASIFIEGSYDGATTDSLGNFSFTTSESATINLKISGIGYASATQTIQLPHQQPIRIILNDGDNKLQEVSIQAGVLQANSTGKNAVLTPLDIVTTAGSMGNIIGALITLPGAQTNGENGRLMVHGGDASETQTYINGLRVAQPYSSTPNNVPVRGRFSPYLFKGVNFSTGGYSAEFGNALSSILALNTDRNIEHSKSDISLSTVGAGLSNTTKWNDRNSLTFNLSYTNLKPYIALINQQINWTKPYENQSGEMVYRHQFGAGFLNIYGAFTLEKMGVKQDDINYPDGLDVKKKTKNNYINAFYSQNLGNRWTMEIGTGIGILSERLRANAMTIPNHEQSMHNKLKFSKVWNNQLKTIWGAEHFHVNYDEKYTDAVTSAEYGYKQNSGSFFTETTYMMWQKLIAKVGIRMTKANFPDRFLTEPRISLGYNVSDHEQISLAFGDFHQQGTTDILKYTQQTGWQKATHYIANYFYQKNGRLIRMEGYYKDYNKLIKYNSNLPTYQSIYTNNGYGSVKGLDFLYRDLTSIKNTQFWFSYSFTDGKRNEANFPKEVTPSYLIKHAASLVAKYWISSLRSQFSITDTYLSGRTYNNPNHQTFMDGQTKGYNNMSFSWSFLVSQQKVLHFSVSNVLGATPIYGYQFANHPDSQGVFAQKAIVPTAKRFIYVGYFWTITKNKKENQLENL